MPVCFPTGTAKQEEGKEKAAFVSVGLGKRGRTPRAGADGGRFKEKSKRNRGGRPGEQAWAHTVLGLTGTWVGICNPTGPWWGSRRYWWPFAFLRTV